MLGRNVTPLYLTTITFNPFGESFGFSPSTRQYFAGAVLGDRSWNNSVAYLNNPRDPLRVHLVANARENNSNGVVDNGHNYGGSMSYLSGPFAAALAWEKIQNSALPVPAGFDRQTVDAAERDLRLQAGAALRPARPGQYRRDHRHQARALPDRRRGADRHQA